MVGEIFNRGERSFHFELVIILFYIFGKAHCSFPPLADAIYLILQLPMRFIYIWLKFLRSITQTGGISINGAHYQPVEAADGGISY